MRIRRALISVSDKQGIDELAGGLIELGVVIVSSGGTARSLARSGIPVTTVSELTGASEMLDGRVKTLHPRIHAGILADRRKPQHLAQLKAEGIAPIDMVICNLYPFAQTAASPGVAEDEVIEQIDIGGPAMVRAAAKNYRSVAVLVNPARYGEVVEEMRSRSGSISDETRASLAAEAFMHTAAYDVAISRWMTRSEKFPERMLVSLDRQAVLRYGENPHQEAAFYAEASTGWRQLAGKQMSYTNLLDLQAASSLVGEFGQPSVAIIKHTNPCGAATAGGIAEAYRKALECDPRSAFGGIVAANRLLDADTARQIIEIMTEIVVAPGFSKEALALFSQRKNLRVVEAQESSVPPRLVLRSSAGGVLIQDPDVATVDPGQMSVVTRVRPSDEDWADLVFAWKVAKHASSNAAVFASGRQAVGIGAGQMSRVEAVEMAARRAGDRSKGSVCASDGFFPFRDGLDAAVGAGVRAVIQPGGSVRDSEVIAAADEHEIPMVFTGRRHFRH